MQYWGHVFFIIVLNRIQWIILLNNTHELSKSHLRYVGFTNSISIHVSVRKMKDTCLPLHGTKSYRYRNAISMYSTYRRNNWTIFMLSSVDPQNSNCWHLFILVKTYRLWQIPVNCNDYRSLEIFILISLTTFLSIV